MNSEYAGATYFKGGESAKKKIGTWKYCLASPELRKQEGKLLSPFLEKEMLCETCVFVACVGRASDMQINIITTVAARKKEREFEWDNKDEGKTCAFFSFVPPRCELSLDLFNAEPHSMNILL